MRRKIDEDFEEEFEEEIAEEDSHQNFEEDLENDGISPEEEGFLRGEREAQDY